MLKIKNNTDLKELEKFGFEKDSYNTYTFYPKEGYSVITARTFTFNTYIELTDSDKGEIDDEVLDKLYDLIQAGLVEKVEE